MRKVIEHELAKVYIYNGKRFLTKSEAVEYKDLLETINDEKELNKKWKQLKSLGFRKLVKKALRGD